MPQNLFKVPFPVEDGPIRRALAVIADALGRSAPGVAAAPGDAQYLVLATDATLTNERRLVAGNGLGATDGGAGGDYTLAVNVDNSTLEIDTDTLRVKDLGISTAKIAADAVTFAKMQNIDQYSFLARVSTGSGDIEMVDLTSTSTITIFPFTNAGDPFIEWRVTDASISNTHLSTMAQSTIKGRQAGVGTGAPQDLTVAQVKTILGLVAGDIAYTPAVLTDWDGDADPGDLDDALDQLAERVDDAEVSIASHTHTSADITDFTSAAITAVTEAIALADLSDVTAKTGSGTTVVMDTSPSLTTPTISGTPARINVASLLDIGVSSGISFRVSGSSTHDNYMRVAGSTTTPRIDMEGASTNISLFILPKGTGWLRIGSGNTEVIDESRTQTLSNKTLTAPTIADFTNANHDHSDADDGGTIDAAVITYTPAVATDWDGDADPGDVNDALDQLAERIDDVEGAVGTGDFYDSITDGTDTATASGGDTFKLRSASNLLTVAVQNNDATHGDNALFTVNQANIDHDALTNFVANEHVDHSAVTLTAGDGLSGGGDITASRSFAVNVDGSTIEINTDALRVKDAGITFAKMQAVSADILLGNDGSGTTVEEIACTAAGRALLDDADASAQRTTLGLGTIATVNSPVPIANGGTGQTAQTAAFDALAPTTTKGDIIVSNGSDNIRLAVGTNTHVLTADSGEASGVKWSAAGTGDVVGPASVTDNRIVRFDGTTGKLIQSAGLSIADISGDTFEIHRGSGGNTALELTVPATASNFVALTSAASGSPAIIASKSTAAPTEDVDLVLIGFNAGRVKANQDGTPREVATISGTQTLTNKTLTTPTIADFTNATHDHSDADDGGLIDASVITYTPTTATDWDGDADPGDVNDALDQLAERVDDLEALGGGSGDVVGPASAGDSNVALFDGTTGKLLKNSDLDYTSGVMDRPGAELGLGHAGNVAVDDGVHFDFGTSTGSKLGLSTSQKLAFFNATPVDQPGNAEDLKDAIVSLGLLASGGATPLDLDTGALLAGTVEAESGGTSKAALKLVSQAAPSAPAQGDHWLDSTKLMHQHYAGGMIQSLGGTVFTQTADVTVANTAGSTTLVGTGIGTVTFPANFWTPGKSLRVTACGLFGTHATNHTLGIALSLGSLGDTVSQATSNSLLNRPWKFEALITCRSTGGSGAFTGYSVFSYGPTSNTQTVWMMGNNGGTTDTTTTTTFDFRCNWTNAETLNTITCHNLVLEVI